MAPLGFTLLRGIFAFSEHVAPGLTGRAAFELFCRTPDPKRVSAREARAIDEAAAFMQEARRHHLPTTFGQAVAYEFRPAGGGHGPTALVMHGWGSRSEHMRIIIDGLRRAGFRVLALDLPGHGTSPGRRLNIALAIAAVRAAADWFGPFRIMVGHSFGGAVAVNAAVGSVAGFDPVPVDRLALIAAPSSMPALFNDFSRFLGLGARAQMALADEVRRVTGHPLEDFVGALQLRETPVPALVIHAPDDKEVSFENARRFEEAGAHVRLMRAPGRGHRRILADDEMAAALIDFAAHGDMAVAAE